MQVHSTGSISLNWAGSENERNKIQQVFCSINQYNHRLYFIKDLVVGPFYSLELV